MGDSHFLQKIILLGPVSTAEISEMRYEVRLAPYSGKVESRKVFSQGLPPSQSVEEGWVRGFLKGWK
jgi:hypothetical protein